MPPLAFTPAQDSCAYGGAECWSLAPWRGRTVSSPGSYALPGQAAPTGTPSWAFAPPMRKVHLTARVPGTFAARAGGRVHAAADRAGCWAFSPSAQCARED